MPNLFYAKRLQEAVPPGTECAAISVHVWRPTWAALPPASIRTTVNWVWWLFHNLGVFANRDFAVVLIERDGKLVHRSGVFPRYFRFPFMARDDLQIGDTWTAPEARGQGLAGRGIAAALAGCGNPGRRFWYVVDDDNLPSIRVIEKAGFTLAGSGARFPRAGVGPLGYYAITAPVGAATVPSSTSIPS